MTANDDHPSAPGDRRAVLRLRGAGRRKPSSARWLARQLNDPYVAAARRLGYRSRAAFKLVELDRRFHLLRRGQRVADLGCAPGGWTQVALARVGTSGTVVGADLGETAPLSGARLLRADIRDHGAAAAIEAALGGPADVVLCDLAPAATGHAASDHLRSLALAEAGFAVASAILGAGGSFVAKLRQGGTESELIEALKRSFTELQWAKPPASRAESAETYIVARDFRRPPVIRASRHICRR
jgi:23S rRNA (uridine2552-2'-O)-methyltransferase